MALESVSAAETLIESNNDEDLEDGEIPSDEDDEPIPVPVPPKPVIEPPKPVPKQEPPKNKNFDSKFNKNKKPPVQTSGKLDRFAKYKNPTEDWAGDVEKAIRAALEEDKAKSQDNKTKNKSRNKNRKRGREEKEEERNKEQKRRRLSDEEDGNEDDDEMLFVRGASPIRKDSRENSSPPRRSNDYDSYDSSSDYDDRPGINRHRENDNKRGGGRGGRRGGKNDRGGKNKGRGQMRNERNNGRRNQNTDHTQDPDSICLYYMQGKCHRGDDCPFSHNALPPRKMELCKFYLMDCCAKREKCLYMHHDFPCKFFHTGLKCNQGENCKFSHEPLNDQVKNILLKHLETAPKEILGDFPRLSREGALLMINNTAKSLSQGQVLANQKIPSLFELNVPLPNNSASSVEGKEDEGDGTGLQTKAGMKERKSPGKKTRWGSDEDRVPYEQIMLLQSANQLGLQLPNAALGLAVQQQLQQQLLLHQRIANMGFYSEAGPIDCGKDLDKDLDFTKDVEEDEIVAQAKAKEASFASEKDIDLRQLLSQPTKPPPVVSIADEAASLSTAKHDDESDRDEETNLVIEMPVEEEDKERAREEDYLLSMQSSSTSLMNEDREIPSHLPKRAQELFLRIQQQQRAAQDSFKNMEDEDDKDNMDQTQEDWYSEDDDEDDDDDGNNLTIVLRDPHREENEPEVDSKENCANDQSTSLFQTPSYPQPAAIVDKLGDLSKIDISAEVSKLLSSIKAQSSTNSGKALLHQKKPEAASIRDQIQSNKMKPEYVDPIRPKPEPYDDYEPENRSKMDVYTSIPTHFHSDSRSRKTEEHFKQKTDDHFRNKTDDHFKNKTDDHFKVKTEVRTPSPRSSPSVSSSTSAISRDPRMSRDPRQQRRDDHKPNSPGRTEPKKESKPLRTENSIYSSGITAMDASMDTDLRAKIDQDHRRKDMDLRQRFTADFGDTDLRVVGSSFADTSSRSDIDLRQMLSLPFKPAPSHVPCTEIDASISSHPPITFKVYVVDIPRPDYTGLKLTKNDPQVKNDPRLRKIFRLTDADLADSPMSPPPAPTKLDTPKSPPQVRSDPRRKTLEASAQSSASTASSVMSVGSQQQQQQQDPGMGMSGQGMPMPMGANPGMMGGPPMGMMGGMGPNGPMMAPMPNMGPMGMPTMGAMGPNGSMMGPNQMNFDPRFNAQRNNGAGLLGPAPGMGFGPPEPPTFEGGPNFPGGNFSNFGPGPPGQPDGMMGFGPNGPNFSGNGGSDWNGGNPNQNNRRGGRIRRRNRTRTNAPGSSNRGNRSPP